MLEKYVRKEVLPPLFHARANRRANELGCVLGPPGLSKNKSTLSVSSLDWMVPLHAFWPGTRFRYIPSHLYTKGCAEVLPSAHGLRCFVCVTA